MAEKNGDDGKTSHDNEIRGRLPFPSFPTVPLPSFPTTPLLSFPTAPLLSFPTFLIGNPGVFSMQGHTKEGTKKKDWIPAENLRE